MNQYIGYCGLNCENCEARIATATDDNLLREKVAKEWSELNSSEITPDMINCVGCRIDGVKTPYEKVDYSFIGFPITEGHHEIDMIYKAPGKTISIFVTLLGLISYIAVIIIEDKRKI